MSLFTWTRTWKTGWIVLIASFALLLSACSVIQPTAPQSCPSVKSPAALLAGDRKSTRLNSSH